MSSALPRLMWQRVGRKHKKKAVDLLKVSGHFYIGGRGDSNVSSPCKDMKKHVITGCF